MSLFFSVKSILLSQLSAQLAARATTVCEHNVLNDVIIARVIFNANIPSFETTQNMLKGDNVNTH